MFNVTPYIQYHPGGVDEILRGAGKDATDLFNEVFQYCTIQYKYNANEKLKVLL